MTMRFLVLAMALGVLAILVSGILRKIFPAKCPRCKTKLVEQPSGDAQVSGPLYCPKCGYTE